MYASDLVCCLTEASRTSLVARGAYMHDYMWEGNQCKYDYLIMSHEVPVNSTNFESSLFFSK